MSLFVCSWTTMLALCKSCDYCGRLYFPVAMVVHLLSAMFPVCVVLFSNNRLALRHCGFLSHALYGVKCLDFLLALVSAESQELSLCLAIIAVVRWTCPVSSFILTSIKLRTINQQSLSCKDHLLPCLLCLLYIDLLLYLKQIE